MGVSVAAAVGVAALALIIKTMIVSGASFSLGGAVVTVGLLVALAISAVVKDIFDTLEKDERAMGIR